MQRKRVRAVLESDDEDDISQSNDVITNRAPNNDDVTKNGDDVIDSDRAPVDAVDSQETDSQACSETHTQHTRIRNNSLQKDTNRLADSKMLDSLDRILGLNTQSVSNCDDTTQPSRTMSVRVPQAIDENAMDLNSKFGFFDDSSAKPDSKKQPTPGEGDAAAAGTDGSGGGGVLLGFTHDMFSTQQAEDEVLGLCSGTFTDSQQQQNSSQKLRESQCNSQESDNTPPAPLTEPFTVTEEKGESVRDPTTNNASNITNGVTKSFEGNKKSDDITNDTDSSTKITAAGVTVVKQRRQALKFSDDEESDNETNQQQGDDVDGDIADEFDDDLDELADDEEDDLDEFEEMDKPQPGGQTKFQTNKTGKLELVLQKPKQTKRQKLMGEYLDEEAELSGSEGGASDEDLDLAAEGDLLEIEQGDMDDVGTDEQLRSQVAKAHAKQRVDDDARQLMLMKEMLLPDGDLHSDSTRQRKFRWRNVEYGSADVSRRGDDSDSAHSSDDGHFSDPEVKALHEKLNKERVERDAWLKQQREEKIQRENEESLSRFAELRRRTEEETQTSKAAPATDQQNFSFNLNSKPKKPGFIFSRSRKYIDDFKKRHANIKTEQSGPTNCKNLLFTPISKEAASKQKAKIWENMGK